MPSPSSPYLYNVSLVAFYHYQPTCLTPLINELQTYLNQTSILKEKFQHYPIEQVHSRVSGGEGIKMVLRKLPRN